MKKFLLCLLAAAVPVLSADVTASVPVSGGNGTDIRVNTADYYSWNTRTEIYTFKFVKASEFAHVLKTCISAYGRIQINDKLNMIIITDETDKLKDILALCAKLDVAEMDGFSKIQSEVIPVSYSRASEILPFVRDFLSIEGTVKSNDALNYLSVSDHPDVIERIRKEIGRFDVPPRQIEFGFHIVEVYKQNTRDIGTSWDKLFDVVRANANYDYQFVNQHELPRSGGEYENSNRSSRVTGNVTLDPSALKEFIKIMVQKKAVNLIADNKILCVNNTLACYTFHYYDKTMMVTLTPSAINDNTLLLHARVTSNGETLLENSTLAQIGKSGLLLRLNIDDSQIINKQVPFLGTVLPYLFSKDVRNKNISSIDILCTPVLR
jgi:hypothetical protein